MPPYSDQDYKDFKEKVRQNGIDTPIIINRDGEILDGHHRWRAYNDLGLKEMPTPVIAHHKDKLEEKLYVIRSNLDRRQLNGFQKIELALKTKPILQEIARRNSETNLKQNQQKTPTDKCLSVDRVNKEIGKRAGVSYETVRKVETILAKATPDQIQRLGNGSTIHTIYKQIQNEENSSISTMPILF